MRAHSRERETAAWASVLHRTFICLRLGIGMVTGFGDSARSPRSQGRPAESKIRSPGIRARFGRSPESGDRL